MLTFHSFVYENKENEFNVSPFLNVPDRFPKTRFLTQKQTDNTMKEIEAVQLKKR